MSKIRGYAAHNEKDSLALFEFQRRELRSQDVKIEILYCGVCHSDLHQVRNEWKGTIYPLVPGHEIVGKVIACGKQVGSFKEGDYVAVGCLVGSCQKCSNCKEHMEQYCHESIYTYNSHDALDGSVTYGGYSTEIVVDEKFVLQIPSGYSAKDLAGVAPLLCAGITTYSPLHHWNVGKGSRVGIVGIGGLGHMAIKIAHAMGAHVVVFTSSPSKVADAKKLGADEVVVTKKEEVCHPFLESLDFMIDTVSVPHNLDTYITLLKRDGALCLVGVPSDPHPQLDARHLINKRRTLAGSLIGGIKETQEMLDFCAKHHLLADIELIPIQKINEAYERMLKNDVKYRFVIDISSLKINA